MAAMLLLRDCQWQPVQLSTAGNRKSNAVRKNT
jgi:hypothetical protein